MRRDFKDIEKSEEKWYDEAVRSRAGWSTLCRDGLQTLERENGDMCSGGSQGCDV